MNVAAERTRQERVANFVRSNAAIVFRRAVRHWVAVNMHAADGVRRTIRHARRNRRKTATGCVCVLKYLGSDARPASLVGTDS
jgi:hypothetical protein